MNLKCCDNCGSQNELGFNFCSKCGEKFVNQSSFEKFKTYILERSSTQTVDCSIKNYMTNEIIYRVEQTFYAIVSVEIGIGLLIVLGEMFLLKSLITDFFIVYFTITIIFWIVFLYSSYILIVNNNLINIKSKNTEGKIATICPRSLISPKNFSFKANSDNRESFIIFKDRFTGYMEHNQFIYIIRPILCSNNKNYYLGIKNYQMIDQAGTPVLTITFQESEPKNWFKRMEPSKIIEIQAKKELDDQIILFFTVTILRKNFLLANPDSSLTGWT